MKKILNSKTDPMPQINPVSQNPLITFGEEDIEKKLKKVKQNEVRIVFFGSRKFVIPVIEAIKDEFNLLAIVTVPDQPVGRHYELTPTPVKEHFLSSNISIYDPELLDQDFAQILEDLNPDLFVVAAYGKLIPDQILKIPRLGALNLHPSLLPKYRGPSPIQNAILNGDSKIGLSYMLLDQKMDHGPIISQSELDISQQDNFESLGNKVFQSAASEIVEIIDQYSKGQLQPVEQEHLKATFTKLIKKEDGYFEIDNPPSMEALDRMIRAYYPWPNAWTRWSPFAKASEDKNNKIVKFLPDQMIQMEGKKAISLKDFLNGYPNFPIKQLQ